MIEYRPCIVKGKKALFHRWADKSQVISPGIAVGSHPGGQVWIVIGIVEYEDGTVHECYPHEVRFCDNKFQEYAFGELET